jgi:hypothetical protein
VTTVSLEGDRGRGYVKARLTDDPRPEPPEPPIPEPVDGAWTIPTEDGPTIVPEKVAAWDAANRAAQARRGST